MSHSKYLKYKTKYLQKKYQLGGSWNIFPVPVPVPTPAPAPVPIPASVPVPVPVPVQTNSSFLPSNAQIRARYMNAPRTWLDDLYDDNDFLGTSEQAGLSMNGRPW